MKRDTHTHFEERQRNVERERERESERERGTHTRARKIQRIAVYVREQDEKRLMKRICCHESLLNRLSKSYSFNSYTALVTERNKQNVNEQADAIISQPVHSVRAYL